MDAAAVIPDARVIGSVAWAKAKTENARRFARIAEDDVRPLVGTYRELVEQRAWLLMLEDEPKTRDRFCEEALGYSVQFLETLDKGVRILDALGHQGRISQHRALTAGLDESEDAPNRDRGPGRPPKESFTNVNDSRPVGNSRKAALRRLARERPDLHQQVLAGEVTPHHAAVEAGFRQRNTTSIRVDDATKAIQTLLKHYSKAELQAALEKVA